jgi:hypothetical protein
MLLNAIFPSIISYYKTADHKVISMKKINKTNLLQITLKNRNLLM